MIQVSPSPFSRRIPFTEFTPPAEIISRLIIHLLPAINPALLILINTRFRNRVKDLFRWELRPDQCRPKPQAEEGIKLSKNSPKNNKHICTSTFITKTKLSTSNVPITVVELLYDDTPPISTPESKRQSTATEVVSLNIPVVFDAWNE